MGLRHIPRTTRTAVIGAGALTLAFIVGGTLSAQEFGGFATLASHRSGVSPSTIAAAAPSVPRVTPARAPLVTTRNINESAPLPYTSSTITDGSLPQGQSQLVTAGVNGVLTTTYRVTYRDGVETGREQVDSTVTTPPVNEVTAIGTYVAPPPPPPPAPVPAPAPAPTPDAAATSGRVIPGGFCPSAESGRTGVAANGRSYVCGGKGPDRNGHLHWNS